MPESFVVDASVVAKWFNKGETNEEEALLVRTAWIGGDIELFSPSLLIYEVCNSIWKNPNIDPDQASSLSKLVVRLAPNLLEVGEDQSSESMNLARKSKLTFYDTVYIILSRDRKRILLSADHDQLEASKNYTKSVHLCKVRSLLRI
jgi:predicted nucleic acid-binding protein